MSIADLIHERNTEFIRLSNGTVVMVPEGADLATFRKVQEARLNPRKARRRAGSRCRRGSRRTNHAQQVIARNQAMAEQVKRANSEDIPFDGRPVVNHYAGTRGPLNLYDAMLEYGLGERSL